MLFLSKVESSDSPITSDNLRCQADLQQREVWLPLNSSMASLPCKPKAVCSSPAWVTMRTVCKSGRHPRSDPEGPARDGAPGCTAAVPALRLRAQIAISLGLVFCPPSSLLLAFNLCLTCCAGNCVAVSAQ